MGHSLLAFPLASLEGHTRASVIGGDIARYSIKVQVKKSTYSKGYGVCREEEQYLFLPVEGKFANFCFNELGKCIHQAGIHRPSVNEAQLVGGRRVLLEKVLGNGIDAAARGVAAVLRVLREGNHICDIISAKTQLRCQMLNTWLRTLCLTRTNLWISSRVSSKSGSAYRKPT